MPPSVLPLKTLREAAEGQLYAPMSVCALVTWFSVPRTSRGTDLYVLLHLSDITLSGEDMEMLRGNSSTERVPDEPPYVTCAIFGPQHLLPQFPAQDEPRIIYLHRTQMVIYKGERQLRVKLRQKGGDSGDTFSIYSVADHAADQDPLVPIATSHDAAEMPQQNRVAPLRIQALRRWILDARQMQLAAPRQATPAAPAGQLRSEQPQHQTREALGQDVLKKVRELVPTFAADRVTPVVGPMAPANLIGKVLAVDFSYYPDHYILHMWDGTEAQPVPLSYTSTFTAADGGEGDERGDRRSAADSGRVPKRPCVELEAGPAAAEQLPLPPFCRLHMPLSSISQFAGDSMAAAATTAGGVGPSEGCSGWEVLSAALARVEMPPEGSAVPLLLPALMFRPASPSPPPSAAELVQGQAAAVPRATVEAAGLSRGSPSYPQPLPRPGDWIKLKHVLPRFVQGQLQLVFVEHSSLELRPAGRNADGPAAGDSRGYSPARSPLKQRNEGGVQSLPFSPPSAPRDPGAWLARVCHPWQALPLRTLRQVLMQQDACDCTPARVLVRVMAVLNPPMPPPPPTAAAGRGPPAATALSDKGIIGGSADTTSPVVDERRLSLLRAVLPAATLRCDQEVVGTRLDRSGNGRTFALALLLQDATASLRAVVLGGAANLFLWDLPPPGGDVVTSTAAARQGQQRPPQQHSGSQSQPSAASQSTHRRVMTRSRAKIAAAGAGNVVVATAATAAAPAAAVEVAPAAAPAPAVAAPPHQREEPGQQRGQAGLDDWDKLIAALRWLSEQSAPGGAWMEAVLRPMYRDRGNPWQSAVYSLEHTVLQLPEQLKKSTARGQGSAPGTKVDSHASERC